MTYGMLRLQIQKESIGVDLELLDGYIQDRYTEILDSLSWKRQEAESVIQVPDSYAVGTITATLGSNAITGAGTTWTADMNGRMIRVDNQSEYYQFTYVSPTTATLDRNFEHATASALAYRIDQAVFLLPSDCRVLRSVKPFHDRVRPLDRISPGELDRLAGSRTTYGTPRYFAQTWDNFCDPPQMQVELYPVPNSPDSASASLSFVADYVFDAAVIDPTATSASLLPWVRPAVIKAGVRADVLMLAKDYNGAEVYDARFKELLGTMARINAQQRGPQEIRMAPEYRRRGSTHRHRLNRPWDGV